MTTTTTMCGLGSEEKPTSRVLRPPGGGSSDIFGVSTPNPTPPRQQQQQGSSGANIFGAGNDTPVAKGSPASQDNSHDKIFGAEPHRIAGKGRNQSQFNPITGEPYASASPAAANSEMGQQQTGSPSVGAAAQPDNSGQGDGTLQAGSGKAQPDVHTSSRVLNPPGGRTHKLW